VFLVQGVLLLSCALQQQRLSFDAVLNGATPYTACFQVYTQHTLAHATALHALCEQAQAEGIVPTPTMFRTVLQVCGTAGQAVPAATAFAALHSAHGTPDSFAWGALMKAYRNAGMCGESLFTVFVFITDSW
jgi:hypothetical protein